MFNARIFKPNRKKGDWVTARWTICKSAEMWLSVDVWVVLNILKDHSAFSLVGTTRWFKYDQDWLRLVYTQIVPVIFEPPCTCQTAIYHLAEYLNLQQHSCVACWCIRVCFSCNALSRNWTRAPRVPTLGQRVNRHAAPSSAGHGLTSDTQRCHSCSSLLSQKSWPNWLNRVYKYINCETLFLG